MSRFSSLLALTCCLLCGNVSADQVPATGKLLVATDEVRGSYFAKTVILLLSHDETGSFGLIINREIDGATIESLALREDLAAFRDSFFWGGPMSQSTMRALMRTDTPPADAEQVFNSVHLVNIDEAMLAPESNTAKLRFFLGYAGWAPGQLQQELAYDSWHVLPATEAVVFAEDVDGVWRKLFLSHQYRASADLPIAAPMLERQAITQIRGGVAAVGLTAVSSAPNDDFVTRGNH